MEQKDNEKWYHYSNLKHYIGIMIMFSIVFTPMIWGSWYGSLPENVYGVTVDNHEIISKSASIQVIETVDIDSLGGYTITYKIPSTWIIWNYDKIRTLSFESDEKLIPTDVVKITKYTLEGTGCKYWNLETDSEIEKPNGFFDRYSLQPIGDRYCGIHYHYEVEKIG